jgi:hypothetical protein
MLGFEDGERRCQQHMLAAPKRSEVAPVVDRAHAPETGEREYLTPAPT